VLAEHLDADPEYRREWERTALARAVAVKVISYRAEHSLSQTALAKCLQMTQPAIARLESGEHNPTFPTLLRLSDALGIELAINIAPTGREPQLIGQRSGDTHATSRCDGVATKDRGLASGSSPTQAAVCRRVRGRSRRSNFRVRGPDRRASCRAAARRDSADARVYRSRRSRST
jgi:transcriptional regulator with XRE-family HTH domain